MLISRVCDHAIRQFNENLTSLLHYSSAVYATSQVAGFDDLQKRRQHLHVWMQLKMEPRLHMAPALERVANFQHKF